MSYSRSIFLWERIIRLKILEPVAQNLAEVIGKQRLDNPVGKYELKMPGYLHGKPPVLLALKYVEAAEGGHLEKIICQDAFHGDTEALKAVYRRLLGNERACPPVN